MNFPSVRDYLFGLQARGAKFGVDRMARLAERLGHPERAYPVIHVAGTNGKGSVCAMLEAMHRRAGRRTGLYTSPHLLHLGERVQVDRVPLTPAEICAYVEELEPHARALAAADADDAPSFFEFMTAMAFLQFQRRAVDVAIVEVGLGGRLDATNIVQSALSIITSIGLDHMEYLGHSLPEIAREKAGIIKLGVPVVLGCLPPEAEAAIREIAAARGAPVHSVREIFGDDLARYPRTNLAGAHQRGNAATATLAARALGEKLPVTDGEIAAALAAVDWPARWQQLTLTDGRTLILDASHNAEGAQTLDAQLAVLRAETGRAPVVLVGALGEYRARPLLEAIARHAREIILLQPNQPRATPLDDLKKLVPPAFAGIVRCGDVKELFPAPGACAAGEPGDVIVATGSIYLMGEMLERLVPAGYDTNISLQDRL